MNHASDLFSVRISNRETTSERSRESIQMGLIQSELCSEDEVRRCNGPDAFVQLGDHPEFIDWCWVNRRKNRTDTVPTGSYLVVLVDLTLLLVAFFVLSSGHNVLRLLKFPGLAKVQGRSTPGVADQPVNDIHVFVTSDGLKVVNREFPTTVEPHELADAIRDAALKTPDGDSRVLIHSRPGADMGLVVKAIDATNMKHSRVTRVAILDGKYE